MLTDSLKTLFHFDRLAITLIFLVSFIGSMVALFATRYMQGDSQYSKFFWRLGLLILAVLIMVSSDNLFLLLAAWTMSNALLIRLMVHKKKWRAARYAGLYTLKILAIGLVSLTCAFFILFFQTKETSIQAILQHVDVSHPLSLVAMALIIIAAMTQSAIWPFHRWLLSSLNSPTPVSAIMHAGLVNGGGFLLARFAPLFLAAPTSLMIIFVFGAITAFLGTLWKLMQHDVKRMLACSTMGQMGFMFVQCGLGLFPAAIAHLCWHGMFKANLFLSSNSAAQEKRFAIDGMISFSKFSLAVACGAVASYFFARAIHAPWFAKDTMLILIGFVFIMATQFSISLFIYSTWQKFPIILCLTVLFAYLYGCSVKLMESFFAPIHVFQAQPLHILYIIVFLFFLIGWLVLLFKDTIFKNEKIAKVLRFFYMKALNASQPHPATVTAYRNDYHYE